MTPKEKAEELLSKFYSNISGVNLEFVLKKLNLINSNYQDSYYIIAKECALIAVDEIIDSHNNDNKWYWLDVKNEIEKL